MDWLKLLRAVLGLIREVMPLPDFEDEEAVEEWLVRLAPSEAELIVLVAGLVLEGKATAALAELGEKLEAAGGSPTAN